MRLNRLFPLIVFTAVVLLLVSAGDPPPSTSSDNVKGELSAALTHRLNDPATARALTFDLFTPELDTAFTTPDGNTAVLWLALHDDTGRLLATEPGLALARQAKDGWQVLLPGDPGWDETLAGLPQGMLPLESSPAPGNAAAPSATPNTLSGYYLPYAAGSAHFLEGSISHFQYLPELGYPSCVIEYCHYAYDFTDVWHFPLLAAKGGTVVANRDSCTDGDSYCTNYMVLYNAGDNAYQLYLHISHGTIPDSLTPGAQVVRGQYLGDTDDTGYSTSNHVHFMVTNSIWYGGDGYYWGYSIDVRFADVPINNGIPRNCYEVTHFPIYDGATECLGNPADPSNPANDWFVSGNLGAYPPGGALTRPAAGAVVNPGSNPLIDVTAAVNDDVGVTAVRLVAMLNGQWVEIGPQITQPLPSGLFDWDVDLCAVGPLNGPLQVAVRAWDYEGNVSAALGPRTIQVDHACPPPISQLDPAVTYDSTAMQLSWTGRSAGAGLSAYQLQWQIAPGGWDAANLLTFPASQLSTWFVGQPGGAYGFRLRAIDINGQPEDWPAGDTAETTANLPATCTADGFEPDDTYLAAHTISLGEPVSGNLCGINNPDWFQVTLAADQKYMFAANSLGGGAAMKITVYGSDGATLQASAAAAGPAQNTVLIFQPGAAGSYYLQIEPLTANLFGTQAAYNLIAAALKSTYLTLIMR